MTIRIDTGECSGNAKAKQGPCIGWETLLELWDDLYYVQRAESPMESGMPNKFEVLCLGCQRIYTKGVVNGRPR